MRTALVISTYNRPMALALCLESVRRQKTLPDEVVVADDGSDEATARLIREISRDFPVKIKHVWQPDEGFRLGKIRNKAIAAADADYIVQIDGDIVMHPCYIKDHLACARPGAYVCGSRIRLNEELTRRIEARGAMPKIHPWSKGIVGKPEKALYLGFGRYISNGYKKNNSIGQGCTIAFWKDDFLKINGYDEHYEGWGCEDDDLCMRLAKAGIGNNKMFMCGIVYHLWHREPDKSRFQEARAYFEAAKGRDYRCKTGVSQYL